MKTSIYFLSTIFSFLLFSSQSIHADGLSDLTSALSMLHKKSDIKVTYEYRYTNSRGDGEDERQESGNVMMLAEANSNGLQLTYSTDVMQTLVVESKLRTEDEDADTPTRNALNDINAIDIHSVLNAAQGIEQLLTQATLVDETPIERAGKPLRQLNFTLPLETLIRDKQTRKYVKKFSNLYQIIIDADGIPIESSLTFEGKGRAYIVIRVEASGDVKSVYQIHNGRLVVTKSKNIDRWDTTFGAGEQISNEVVNIQP
jgi:hypothetical protein